MSELGFLEKLLDGAGVEWKALGDVTKIKTGQSVNKNKIANNLGSYPVINSGREPLGFIDEWNTEADPIGVTTRGAGVGSITWQEGKYFRGNLNYAVTANQTANLSIRFLYHLLLEMQSDIHELCTFDGIPALNAGRLKGLLVPIPCPEDPEKSLEIQAEIVCILDAFTELTTELTARKKQYNHYRDQLLSFEEGDVEWKTLGEVASIGTGSRNTNESVLNGKYPFFVRSQKPRAIDEFEFDDTAIITAGDGVGVGKVFHYMSGKYALHQRAYRIVVTDDDVNSKYLFHYIRNNFALYLKRTSVHASVTSLRMPMFQKYPVPIPKKDGEQARIVAILDKFDALTTSLSEGLPREIELRQKQYAYYRDLLLSFPKPEDAV